jgi:putative transposase
MGLRYPDQINHNCFFVTTSFKNRKKYGEIEGVYEILEENLIFYSNKYKAKISGYVLMPSHLHMLLFINGDKLSRFMRDFKKFTAQKSLTKCAINSHNVWMSRYDRLAIVTEEIFRIKLNYIHYNPVRAGLVTKPEDWRWSSAASYFTDNESGISIWKEWAG